MKIYIDRTQLLGEGCFGQVFVGTLFSQKVAAKKCRSNSRLDAEAHLLGVCQHTQVVTSYSIVIFEQEPYLIMELAAEGPLWSLMGLGKFSTEERKLLVRQMCSGLDHIHSKRIVHRDIHMGNMLMRTLRPLHLVIADFGEALYDDESRVRRNFHEIVFDQPYSYKSDVYLLALVTCQLFEDKKHLEVRRRHLNLDALPREPHYGLARRMVELSIDQDPAKRPTAAQFSFGFRECEDAS